MRFVRSLRLLAVSILTASVLMSASGASAGVWPSRTIKLIVPFPPGGAADTVARVYADKLSEALKQPVVVRTRQAQALQLRPKPSPPRSPMATPCPSLLPASSPSCRISTRRSGTILSRSFVPVSNLATVPYVLAVGPDTPISNARDLVAAANDKIRAN